MNWNELFKEFNDFEKNETIQISYLVANYCKTKNIELTNLKLQKLLYFINVEYLIKTQGEPIFKERFLAWRHGPVLQSVYDVFKYGISFATSDQIVEIQNKLGNFKLKIINKVLDKMALLDTCVLVSKAHGSGTPWYTVYHSNKTSNNSCFSPIDHSIIYNYYKIKENKPI